MDSYIHLIDSLRRDMDRAAVSASNVANVATPGFKRWVTPGGTEANAGAAFQATRDLTPGRPVASGRHLDIMLAPNVYLGLEGGAADQFSRGGRLEVNAEGRLVTSEGVAVVVAGQSGALPADVEITGDGRILHRGVELGRLSLVRADHAQLVGNDRYLLGETQPVTAGAHVVQSGVYEGSNVQLTEEMIAVMQTLRHLDSVQKVFRHEEALNERLFSALAKF